MMETTFSPASQSFTLNPADANSWGADLIARVDIAGFDTFSLRGVQFGITVEVDGQMVLDKTFPPSGVKFSRTDNGHLATERVRWRPDDSVTIYVWVDSPNIQRVDHTETFKVPRPPKPYESWVWDDTQRVWVAPKPYPDGDAIYDWDEGALDWVASTEAT